MNVGARLELGDGWLLEGVSLVADDLEVAEEGHDMHLLTIIWP